VTVEELVVTVVIEVAVVATEVTVVLILEVMTEASPRMPLLHC
jgi:hypothetical protein